MHTSTCSPSSNNGFETAHGSVLFAFLEDWRKHPKPVRAKVDSLTPSLPKSDNQFPGQLKGKVLGGLKYIKGFVCGGLY